MGTLEALQSNDLPRWTPYVPGRCQVCGWPPGAVRSRLARVPQRNPPEPSLPCPPFGSTTSVLTIGSKAKSADFLCQALQVLPTSITGRWAFPPIRGVSSAPCSTCSLTVVTICGVSVQEPMSESPNTELSMSYKFIFVCSIMVLQVMAKYGPPSINPILDIPGGTI